MNKHTYGRTWYGFITDRINAPAVELLTAIGKLPEPTKDNTRWPLCWALIDIRDEFFRHETNHMRSKVMRAAFNYLIAKCSYDPYYHKRIAKIIRMVIKTFSANPEWLRQADWLDNGSDQWWGTN